MVQDASPPAAQAPASGAKTGGIVTLVGAGLSALGTLLPYAEATGPFGFTFHRAGVQTDGFFVLLLSAVPATVAAAVFLRREPGHGAQVLAFLGSIGTAIALIRVWFEIANSGLSFPDLDVQTGIGVYVSLIGVIILFVGCVMALPKRPPEPPPA